MKHALMYSYLRYLPVSFRFVVVCLSVWQVQTDPCLEGLHSAQCTGERVRKLRKLRTSDGQLLDARGVLGRMQLNTHDIHAHGWMCINEMCVNLHPVVRTIEFVFEGRQSPVSNVTIRYLPLCLDGIYLLEYTCT